MILINWLLPLNEVTTKLTWIRDAHLMRTACDIFTVFSSDIQVDKQLPDRVSEYWARRCNCLGTCNAIGL